MCNYIPDNYIYTPLFNNTIIESFNNTVKDIIKTEIIRMFNKSMSYYMTCAFPHNELKPLTCKPNDFDAVPKGMLTLVDSLDTFIILGLYDDFKIAVDNVCDLSFDIDQNVSLFETTIRFLGGLLSAHIFATDVKETKYNEYDGCLLEKAIDLADRLIVAFDTPTGIPFGTVNLKYGVPYRVYYKYIQETNIASLAGAGSLYLEFGILSSLTDDLTYIHYSRRALESLINSRSNDDLYGKHINITNGKWTETTNGFGSNSDSFFEYLYKGYILFDDKEMYKAFIQTTSSMNYYNIVYLKLLQFNDWLVENTISNPKNTSKSLIIDALSTFYPGLLALNGQLEEATSYILPMLSVWNKYLYFPELYTILPQSPGSSAGNSKYLLRPETIESLMYIYQGTKDDSWLKAGLDILDSIRRLEVRVYLKYFLIVWFQFITRCKNINIT